MVLFARIVRVFGVPISSRELKGIILSQGNGDTDLAIAVFLAKIP